MMNTTTKPASTGADRPDPAIGRVLIDTARRSIVHGLEQGCPLPVRPEDHPMPLREQRATFVTLTRGGQLRGCIGMLEAIRPLIVDVAENAWAAAFRDPRFPPLRREEYPQIRVSVSVLTPPEDFPVRDEADLLARLVPGEHGLILEAGHHRATFLPKVWDELPDPHTFLAHLKLKAGLPADYWSAGMRFQVYRSIDYAEDAA